MSDLEEALERARGGGPQRHRDKSQEQGKLPVRERVARLVDSDSFVEDALLANWEQDGFGADGVVTGMATVAGRPVALMANDPTVKAGSWGPKTVEKIIRIQEQALEHLVPMIYLVDSAGARITEQVQMFPGRRGAGRIFHTEVKLSGVVPQICVLFGPSAAGGAYIPAFCDVVIMRDGNASMYLGSPRMAEMVIGETVTLEEMGGARMHTSVSGCGHFLVKSDEEGIDLAKRYLGYFPVNWHEEPPAAPPGEPAAAFPDIPVDENKPFDMIELIDALVDAESFLEVHKRWAKVRDGRPGVRPGRVHRPPERQDRRDGPAGRHQRRLLQPAPGDRRPRRARAPHRGAARRVRVRDRHPAPGLRAGDRRRGAARRPALRPDQAAGGLCLAGPVLAGQAESRHARLDSKG
jgi:acetyl-CoA carboxylase carboxyltransferase component